MSTQNPFAVQFNVVSTDVGYDRSETTPGIVHIGPSHFARSHWFKIVNDLLKTDSRWGIRAISPKSSGVKQALESQQYLYPLIEQGDHGVDTTIIGSLMDIIVATEAPAEAVNVLSDPNIKLVTMTITEAGYYYNKETENLDFDDPDIKECLSNIDEPSTTVGLIVAALEERMRSNSPPLTIMSCDNMEENGTVLRNVMLAYADKKKNPALGEYIREKIKFPTTMVDRITPSTPAILQITSDDTTYNWPVTTTPMPEYAMVIEDNFAGAMPNLKSVGVTIVDDVTPFKNMKIRLLNGAHMAIGCIGKLSGYGTVIEAIRDPQIENFIKNFIAEAKHTLRPSNTVNYDAYADDVLKRLQNPHIEDDLTRLVRNGTDAKIKKRVLDALQDGIAHGTGHEHLSFATAAWMHYLKGIDQYGEAFDINDKHGTEIGLPRISKAASRDLDPSGIIGASGVFDHALQGNYVFQESIDRHFRNIDRHGISNALNMIDGPVAVPVQKLEIAKG
jgi:mannitol 2-dehydrogenase